MSHPLVAQMVADASASGSSRWLRANCLACQPRTKLASEHTGELPRGCIPLRGNTEKMQTPRTQHSPRRCSEVAARSTPRLSGARSTTWQHVWAVQQDDARVGATYALVGRFAWTWKAIYKQGASK